MADPSPLVPLPFLEAIAWARKRQVVLPEVYYGQLQGLARAQAFTIAGISSLDQLQQVSDSLADVLESGETFRDWQKRVAAGEIPLELSGPQLETLFRNNIQQSYNRGRYEQQAASRATHPFYMYDAVNDSRTRPTHAAMDGHVAPADDPVWETWTPACGHRCLLPETTVQGEMRLGLKAWYAGEAVEVSTAHGRRLSVTVNHPVLTRRGWVAAGNLQVGDDLLGDRLGVGPEIDAHSRAPSRAAGGVDDEKAPPTAEHVFEALATHGRGRAPRAAFDLYGDALLLESDVEVVGAEAGLVAGVRPEGAKTLQDGALGGGDHGALGLGDVERDSAGAAQQAPGAEVMTQAQGSLFDPALASPEGDGNFLACGPVGEQSAQLGINPRVGAVAAGLPGGTALSFDQQTVGAQRPPFDALGGSATPSLNADGVEPIGDAGAAHAEVFGQSVDARSGQIASQNGVLVVGGPADGRARADDAIGILRRAACHPMVTQQPREQAVADATFFEDLAHRCAGLITPDQVNSVRHFAFRGHVYDFETGNGLILAGGVIVSNCRCRRIALTPGQAERYRDEDAQRLVDPEAAAERASAIVIGPDKGWGYDVYRKPNAGLKEAINQRARRCAPTQLAAKRTGGCIAEAGRLLQELRANLTRDVVVEARDLAGSHLGVAATIAESAERFATLWDSPQAYRRHVQTRRVAGHVRDEADYSRRIAQGIEEASLLLMATDRRARRPAEIAVESAAWAIIYRGDTIATAYPRLDDEESFIAKHTRLGWALAEVPIDDEIRALLRRLHLVYRQLGR